MPVTTNNLVLNGWARADQLRLARLIKRYLDPVNWFTTAIDDVLDDSGFRHEMLESVVKKLERHQGVSLKFHERDMLWMVTYAMLSADHWAYPHGDSSDPEDVRVCLRVQQAIWVE